MIVKRSNSFAFFIYVCVNLRKGFSMEEINQEEFETLKKKYEFQSNRKESFLKLLMDFFLYEFGTDMAHELYNTIEIAIPQMDYYYFYNDIEGVTSTSGLIFKKENSFFKYVIVRC